MIFISLGSASNSNLSFLMSIKIKNTCLCAVPSKAANTFTFHPPKEKELWLLRTFSGLIRHYLSSSWHDNLLFVAQLLIGFFGLMKLRVLTNLMVTHVRHSVYLSSLSHSSWSLMLHTVSTYPYGSSIGHWELNFPFSFLTHYHHHWVYQCYLCQPLNHVLLNVYSVNHICSVYAHSSLLPIQIVSGPDGSSIRP